MQNAEEKTVDIDTSGPGAEVELPEEQTPESNIEVSNDTADKDSVESNDSTEKSDEQSTVQADTGSTHERLNPTRFSCACRECTLKACWIQAFMSAPRVLIRRDTK